MAEQNPFGGAYDSSLTASVRSFHAGAEVVAAGFPGGAPALALADGGVLFVDTGTRVTPHPDAAILLAQIDGERIVTGGDDGRVVETRPDGTMVEIGDEKGRWIDALALRADGSIAWSAGKQVRARDPKGVVKNFEAPSSVRGLAFLPKGYRLAMAK